MGGRGYFWDNRKFVFLVIELISKACVGWNGNFLILIVMIFRLFGEIGKVVDSFV